jgi:hypothetical protein
MYVEEKVEIRAKEICLEDLIGFIWLRTGINGGLL